MTDYVKGAVCLHFGSDLVLEENAMTRHPPVQSASISAVI